MLLFCIVKHFRLSSIISFEKNDISIEKINECVSEQHCQISKVNSQIQQNESFTPLVYAMNEMDLYAC